SDLARVPAGGSRLPFGDPGTPRGEYYLSMNGASLFARAVRRMISSALNALKQTGWSTDDVEAFISHQANQRIIDAVADRLKIPESSRHGNVRELGNTAAASIPLALADAAAKQVFKPGARTLITGFGGGLAWGSHTLNFPEARPHSRSPHADD